MINVNDNTRKSKAMISIKYYDYSKRKKRFHRQEEPGRVSEALAMLHLPLGMRGRGLYSTKLCQFYAFFL